MVNYNLLSNFINEKYKEKKYSDIIDFIKNKDIQYDLISSECCAKIASSYRMVGLTLKSEDFIKKSLMEYPESDAIYIEYAALKNLEKKWEEAFILWSKSYFFSKKWSLLNYKRYILSFKKITDYSFLSKNDFNIFFKMLYEQKRWNDIVSVYEKIKIKLEDSFFDEIINEYYNRSCYFLGVNNITIKNNNLTNIAYLPGNNHLWLRASKFFFKANVNISLVIEHSPSIRKRLKTMWPESEIYDGFDLSSGATLLIQKLKNNPDTELLKSPKFLDFKVRAINLMDRQDNEGRYRLIDREAVFYSLFFFFYSKLIEKKISLIVAAHAPHVAPNFILYETARLLGIKTVHCIQNSIIPAFQITSNYYGSRYHSYSSNQKIPDYFLKKMMSYCDELSDSNDYIPDYMQKMKQYDINNSLDFNIKVKKKIRNRLIENKDGKSPSKTKGSWSIKSTNFLYNNKLNEEGLVTKDITNSFRLNLLYEYFQLVDDITNSNDIYVYYPLHYEPEKNSNPDGGHYYDTYKSLVALRNFLPENIFIYIKEHYSQFSGARQGYTGRSPYFYKAIKQLKNIKIIDFNHSSSDLIRKSLFVCTKVGNAALEAACMEKKAILFGYPWFYNCPNVYIFDEIENYNSFINIPEYEIDSIKLFFKNWVKKYAIYGPMSGGQEVLQKQRNPEMISSFMDMDKTADSFVLTLKKNGFFNN